MKKNEVGRQIKYLGGTRVLLHYQKNINELNNLLDKTKRSLRLTGLDFVELSENDAKTPCTMYLVLKVSKYAERRM